MKVFKFIREGETVATKSYLQQSLALGRTVAEAVDGKVRARQFAYPARSYKECLIDVLHEDEELARAYRDSP